MRKIDFLILFFFVIVSFFSLKDLFLPGFYTSHDGPHQVVRAFYYHKLITEGQFPPRWVGGLNYGFGYPLFIFSYQMPWLIAEPFRFFGFSVIASVKMVFLVGFLFSAVTMYFYQRSLFGRLSSFIGATLYLFAPYRFSNIFVRASIGDATAFIFAPLIFWFFDRLTRPGKATFTILVLYALSLTALLLSHAMVFFFFALSLLLYFIFKLIISSSRVRIFSFNLKAAPLFLGFSAFYLFPSFFERSFTRFTQIMQSTLTSQKFVSLNRLLYSPWGYGTFDAPEGAMSLQVGIAQWGVVFVSFLLLLFLAFKFIIGKRKILSNSRFSTGFFFLALFVFSVFLMNKASLPFWSIVNRYVIIDFTWRILAVTVFSASILAGWLVKNLPDKKLKVLAGFIFLILAFYGNRNHLRINKTLSWPVSFFLKLEKTTNSFDEYLPRWTDPSVIKENAPRFQFTAPFESKILEEKSNRQKIDLSTSDAGIFTLNTLYYPGWTAFDNDQPVKIENGSGGLISFPIKRGEHQLLFIFEKTPLRRISDLATFFTIILTTVFIFRRKKSA